MSDGVKCLGIEGRSVSEVDQRARRLVIAYAILLDALEHPYPDERDCSPDLSDDHFDFFQLTVIGLAALSLLTSFGVVLRLIDP
jgi:hypothetical protein